MFNSARLKLTGWYMLIIILISCSFSVIIYSILTSELDQNYQRVLRRYQDSNLFSPFLRSPYPPPDPEIIEQSKDKIKLELLYLNIIVLALSSAASFFLANKTLKPIQKAMEEQSRFVADASHELRTPLTALKTSLEVNLRDKDLNLKNAKLLLKDNLDEVNSLQSLSDGLLQLSSGESLTNQTHFKQISLKDILEKVIKKLQPLALSKKITLKNKSSDILIESNFDQLTELFTILLDNAIKYSPPKTEVSITSKKIDSFFEFKVIDQGIGIDPKDLPHIFNRFYRADQSRSKEILGFGLGLSIAKKIVQQHHGSIQAESQLNEGTTFIIKLPIKQSKRLMF